MDRTLRIIQALGITQEELNKRADEFFAQDVATGPLLPSELNKPTTRNENTMTEPIQIQGRKLIMSFSRTKQVTQYEPMQVSATMEVDLPPGTTIEQARAVFTDEYAVIKGEVYRQMDLPFTWDENEKLIMETFPGAQVVAQAPAPAPALAAVPSTPAAASNPFSPPAPATPGPLAASLQAPDGVVQVAEGAMGINGKPLKAGDAAHWNALVAELATGAKDKYGNTSSYYDNRAGKAAGEGNPNGPDFKDKATKQHALWLNSVPQDMAHLFQ